MSVDFSDQLSAFKFLMLLLQSWVCDREADCGQSDEDERDCEYTHEPCAANEFQCDNKLCIPNEYKCDHDNDCGDNSDEPSSECQYRVCQENEFTCRNGKCILGGLRSVSG